MAGSRFYDGRTAAELPVTLHPTEAFLRITSQDGRVLRDWSVTAISQQGEPDPDGYVTLIARGDPGRLQTTDRDVLFRIGLRVRRGSWSGWTLLLCCAGFLALAAIAVLLLEAAPGPVARLIPWAWEVQLGAAVQPMIAANDRVCRTPAAQGALDALGARLANVAGIPIPVRITVLDDPMVNALTLPGGRILLMRGLIVQAKDGAELAGVLAHEMAHVAHRDAVVLMVRRLGVSVVVFLLGLDNSAGQVAGLGQDLLALSYSRQAEAAADAAGLDYLQSAGLRADGLGRFFAQLEAEAPKHGPGFAWLRTHPPTERRRAAALRAPVGAEPFTPEAWQAVRAVCAP